MKTSTGVVAGLGAAAVAGAAAGLLRYGIHGQGSQLFGASVYRGARDRRSVALTFDDGPSQGTPALLDYLAKEGVRATFFQCGMNVLRHPQVARRVRDEGHEIGNHTFSHARLCPRLGRTLNLRSPENIYRELAETQAILEEVTGVVPTLFRAPYGMRWYGLGAAQRRLGLLGVLWTVIGHDWEWPADRIAAHVLEGAEPGGIVCLHDGRDVRQEVDLSGMLAALRVIVAALRRQGYSFETVSELLGLDRNAERTKPFLVSSAARSAASGAGQSRP